VIVGAGAAGIGAGLALRARGIPFLILEAADRIGGRAYTDKTTLPHRWDQGCAWLHCADVNPLVAWADRVGAEYETYDRVGRSRIWSKGLWLDHRARDRAQAQITEAIEAVYAAAREGRDVPIADLFGQDRKCSAMARYVLKLLASEDPEGVSTLGYADYHDTEVNWLMVSGYGDLIDRMAAGLPIRRGTEVTAIAERPGGVSIHTVAGPIAARAAIVTASTSVLLSGRLTLPLGAPQDLLALMQDVPCGAYEKVALALTRLPFDTDGEGFVSVEPAGGGEPLGFQIGPARQPVLIAHLAGSTARALRCAGAAEMTAYAMERLTLAFGSDVRKLVVASAVTDWLNNPFVQGAYSHTRPGTAPNRHKMIALDTGPVVFAGEAFSRGWQATAHGAFQSGQDAAARLAVTLDPRDRYS